MNDTELLREFGLSESEAKIYSTLMRHGPMTSGKIVTLSKQHVSVTYYSVQRLVEKGLVTHVKKGRLYEYSAVSPEVFLTRIEEMRKEFQERMPVWNRMSELNRDRTDVEVFDGFKGITNMYNQMFKDAKRGEEYRIFSVGEEYSDPEIVGFISRLNRKQEQIGLRTKMVCSTSHRDVYGKVDDPKYVKTIENLNLRFVDFEFPQGVVIFRGSVAFISFEDPQAILITSEKISRQYKKFFDNLYRKGDPYRKK